jgi:hypothetical protein
MFDDLFDEIEDALDKHPALRRVEPFKLHDARMSVTRGWFHVEILVKRVGSRKKPFAISGNGETPREAVDALINGLDGWAEVLK